MVRSNTVARVVSPKLPVAIGDVLSGKYRVERVLGEGGLGIVASAHQLALNVRVALKFLHPQLLSDRTLVARFEREAQIAARLHGEGVARVFDVDHLPSGAPFIVMEYLNGEDLDAFLMRTGALPVGVAVDYARQVCTTMAEAHAAKIVHRDLKPQNLFLTRRANGTTLIKVLDFGISKLTDEKASKLTGTGEIFGTPQFMAPEQFRGEPTDARTDIWGLGSILYLLLTGALPFGGSTMAQICTSVLHSAPEPLSRWNPSLPAELDAVVRRALEKDPANRYPNVEALSDALLPFVSNDPDVGSYAPAFVPPPSPGSTSDATFFADAPFAANVPNETFRAVATSPRKTSSSAHWGVMVGGALGVLVAASFFFMMSRATMTTRTTSTASASFDPPSAEVPSTSSVVHEDVSNAVPSSAPVDPSPRLTPSETPASAPTAPIARPVGVSSKTPRTTSPTSAPASSGKSSVVPPSNAAPPPVDTARGLGDLPSVRK